MSMSMSKSETEHKQLSKHRKACGGKRVITAKVRFIICGITTNQEAEAYIEEAVRHWGGQLEFPNFAENGSPGDPLCSCFTYLVSIEVRNSRLSQQDVTSYLEEVRTGYLEEYEEDVN